MSAGYAWLIFVFIVWASVLTHRGTIEWTFDGVHHTLLLGQTSVPVEPHPKAK